MNKENEIKKRAEFLTKSNRKIERKMERNS